MLQQKSRKRGRPKKDTTQPTRTYDPRDFGEEEFVREFKLERDDAKAYFMANVRPRLDRSYKLFIAYNGDRAQEIQKWQANIFVPYVMSVVETLMPRVLDARPDFGVQGRTMEDETKAKKVKYLTDYFWEIAGMDAKVENFVRAAMVYGTGFLQVYWKKDVRKLSFLKTTDANAEPVWVEKEKTFYDAPCADWVDNYSLLYDWRNSESKDKRFWMKRLVLTKDEIERRYPLADPKKLALLKPGGDITDWAQIRQNVKRTHDTIAKNKSAIFDMSTGGFETNRAQTQEDENNLFEVYERWRPFDDSYSVIANDVPIFEGAEIPNPYDFKESPFIAVPYLKVPGEFEGYGLPMVLENPQIMLNMIKNQRLDAVTMSIHKMWVVNPLANIDKKDLITRPFGIVWTTDVNGVKEIQFSDVKQSAYQEESMLKQDMRYASGVDDFSMGAGGQAGSATEVRHLRESTIERVRLFVNHLGDAFATMQRYWISMTRQFFTKEMTLRVVGEDGTIEFPLIEKDDIMGEYDFKATVLPSIAGQNEIKKKQNMDLLQLLMQVPFIDQQKLVAKILYDWEWDYNSIAKSPEAAQEEQQAQMMAASQQQGPDQAMAGGIPPEMMQQQQSQPTGSPDQQAMSSVIEQALQMLGNRGAASSGFAEAAAPIPLSPDRMPPTVSGVPIGQTTNTRGANRAKVNTNIPMGNKNANPESSLINRAFNIQR